MPTALLTVLPFVFRRAVYQSDDKNGVVFFGPHRPIVDAALALILAVALLPIFSAFFFAFIGLLSLVTDLLLDASMAIALGGVLMLLIGAAGFGAYGMMAFLQGSSFQGVTGPETPKGDRYMVASLAQHPGTGRSALLLTRALIRALPPGKILVTRAGSEKLARDYERLGFVRGSGFRVYMITR